MQSVLAQVTRLMSHAPWRGAHCITQPPQRLNNLSVNARQSDLKLPRKVTQLFISSFYLFKEESVVSGRWKN